MTGYPALDALVWIGTGLTTLFLVLRAVRGLRRLMRRVGDFLDDWNGQEARPGHKAIPSVPERLALVENSVEELRKSQPRGRSRPDR